MFALYLFCKILDFKNNICWVQLYFSFSDPIDYSNFKRETSSEDASSTFLDGLVASTASNSPPALVSTTGLNLTSAVAVVKPTISTPETHARDPEEDPFLNTDFEKKPLIEEHSVEVSGEKAAGVDGVVATVTEPSKLAAQDPLSSPTETKPTGKSVKIDI